MSDRPEELSNKPRFSSLLSSNDMQALTSGLESRRPDGIELSVRELIERLRRSSPRIQVLTNTVTTSIVANTILSLGGTPCLSDSQDEIEIAISGSDGLLINLGTPSRERKQVIKLASSVARENSVPWLLDPVMVDNFPSRLSSAIEILSNKPSVIRGNHSEIRALCTYFSSVSGLDDPEHNASYLAQQTDTIVVSTGRLDFITDGNSVISFDIGDPIQQKVVGIGCAMSGILSVLLSISSDAIASCVGGVLISGEAATIAAQKADGPGSFPDLWIDAIYNITQSK